MPVINAAYPPTSFNNRMDVVSGERSPPPTWVPNVTCHHPLQEKYLDVHLDDSVEYQEVIRSLILFLVSTLIIISNSVFICTIHSFQYRRFKDQSSTCLLTSLSVADLLTGLLITAVGVYPAITECWPFGKTSCRLQALLRGSLRQHRANSLILLALERYIHQTDSNLHSLLFSHLMCSVYSVVSAGISMSLYIQTIIKEDSFFFTISSFSVCEPYFVSLRLLVLTTCLYYFPATMIVMYCYGSIFHSQKEKLRRMDALRSTLPLMIGFSLSRKPLQHTESSIASHNLTKSISALSLSFIILSTPWSILQIITSVTMEEPLPSLDFGVNLMESSQCFLSPVIFYLLNPRFRQSTPQYFSCQVCYCPEICCCCNRFTYADPFERGCEEVQPDVIGEKYWGDILERAHSHPNLDRMSNNLSSHHLEMHEFDEDSDIRIENCIYRPVRT